jgi:hypothetical protein
VSPEVQKALDDAGVVLSGYRALDRQVADRPSPEIQ